jgi:hypothetical protein
MYAEPLQYMNIQTQPSLQNVNSVTVRDVIFGTAFIVTLQLQV